MLMTILLFALGILAFLVVLTTLLPLVPLPHGIFRVFDFPRLQNVGIAVAVVALTALVFPLTGVTLVIIVSLGAALLIQAWFIARFTPLWSRRSRAFEGRPEDVPTLTFLVSNVKLANDEHHRVARCIAEADADIILLMEVDDDWLESLEDALAPYPHRVLEPRDTGYGIAVASRVPFSSAEVRHLLNEHVPSIDLRLELGGEPVRIYVLHPEPPTALNDTMGRDAELSAVGQLVRGEEAPLIVTGDLNDVAWSRTTRRFLRLSRLLDPREGRGFYNSFDARHRFLRWPLDHIFHSEHFSLVSMARLAPVGSDHFPMFYHLALEGSGQLRREIDEATPDDRDEAADLVRREKRDGDDPVGMDWEDGRGAS